MNIKEIEYILKIAEEGNLTRAAEKIYLTPSALNQQILNLERNLGQPLFLRDRNGWIPTEAGIVYLEGARQILQIKQNTYRRLQDLRDAETGSLAIGFPPERGGAVFNHIYTIFHQQYPRLTIKLIETSVKEQHRLLEQGQLDIGFVTLLPSQQENFMYQYICDEEFVLVLPKIYASRYKLKFIDWVTLRSLSKELPLAMISKDSTLYRCLTDLFQKNEFVPYILLESARIHTLLEAVGAGFCFSIVPKSNVITPQANIELFPLQGRPSWQIMSVYKKNAYLTEAAKTFIALSSRYWQTLLGKRDII
ncbi:LysR family transcriptional regulator [Gallibacterium salpingitidis]|uniref:HTH lysR-type domain-containing protein n=1 Tax=Gallibacterium salpingitidis TaxID=505341 RepID=A0A1A7NZK5_9PAST|nr:LysR family transcriptional regulator [Gallibacterium salpingitidis]OBW95637.1 hypothetical protein QS62_02705 [Gallibacterium salpingitidis]